VDDADAVSLAPFVSDVFSDFFSAGFSVPPLEPPSPPELDPSLVEESRSFDPAPFDLSEPVPARESFR
jgi:hypothetical protein